MRVFITGASGHIGSAVIPELLNTATMSSGWPARTPRLRPSLALAPRSAAATLTTSSGLRRRPAEADGVIHLAFKHEAMRTGDFMGAVDSDLAAIQAIGETLIGTDKPFVTTGGTLMLAMGGITGSPGHRGRSVQRAVPGLTRRSTRSRWHNGACVPRSYGLRRWSTATSTITASPLP